MFEVLSGCNVIGHGIFGSMASNSEPPQSPNHDNIEMEGIGSLTLPNSLKAPIERFQLLGNSTQGCTIKVLSTELEQGTINAGNGENFPSNYRVRTKGFSDIQKGKYKVTCEGAKQANVIFYSTDGIYKNTLFKAHTVFPFYFTANEACKIRVAVSNGTEAEAITIKPNNVKSITVETEISPEYKQEIKSVGRKSRNLFDISKNPYKCDEEKICIPSKPLGEINITNGITFEEKTVYYLSWESYTITKPNSDWSPIFGVEYTDKVREEYYMHFYKNGTKTNANKTIKYVYIRNPWSVGTEVNRIQIEKGTKRTEYEPYGMYLLDVQVSGRNLVDIDALRNENGKIDSVYTRARDISSFDVVKDRKYLLIGKGTMLIDVMYSAIHFGKDDLEYQTNNKNILSTGLGYKLFTGKETRIALTAKETCTVTKVIIHGNAEKTDAYIAEELGLFEISDNDINIDYEPYKEPQTTQIALDEPLRGIGEYKDVITKDGILRKIKEIVLDENTGFTNHLGGMQNKTICFATHILKDATNISALNNAMSDKIEKVTYVDGQDKECFTLFNKQIYIKLNRERNVDTVEKLKEWLKQNPVTVQYVLKEPTTEQLQTELGNPHTYNGTTIVTVDSGEVETGIKLTYRKEK